MDISKITKAILKNCQKIGKITPLTVKKLNFQNILSLQFLITQDSLNPIITFLGEKLWPVAFFFFFFFLVLYKETNLKMAIKSVKMKISKNEKTFLGQKVCSVAHEWTDRQTYSQADTQPDRHESEYRGHPYRVSGFFPSTYHHGSVQKCHGVKRQKKYWFTGETKQK